MTVSENIAEFINRYKQARQLSYSELADELGIAKSAVVEYSHGTGNPRADTIELLAKRCGVPVTEIVSAPLPGQEQAETIVRAAEVFASLTPEQRERGFRLFRELAALFAENYPI